MELFTKLTLSIITFLVSITLSQTNLIALDHHLEDTIIFEYLWEEVINLKPTKERPLVAVVLSGGGARGFAHIGVLRVLETHRIPIDIVVGTSAGAIIGGLYASGVPLEKLENIAGDIGWDKLTELSGTSIINLFTTQKLLSTENMDIYLKRYLGDKNFYELPRKFVCVATDITTGEKIVFTEGKVRTAIRASATIPGIFEPVSFRHRLLVDGGLVDNIPVDVARELGAEIVIVLTARGDISKSNLRSIFGMLTQAIYIQGQQLENESLKKADIIISPDVKDISIIEFSRAKECIDAGIIAGNLKINDIKKLIINRTLEYIAKKK